MPAKKKRKKIFSQVDEGYEKPIPTGRKNSKQTDLYITLDKESGEWVLTDAAGRFEKGYGGNIVTFKTAEEAKKYIK